MKTLNERVKDVVRTVVLDADYTELGEQSKAVQDWLQNDAKFIQLKKALEDYRLKTFAENAAYQKISRATLFTAFVAVAKLVKGVNIPENYLTEDNGKTLERLASENICDTDSRIASLICRINDTFRPIKETRKADVTPYTFGEIRKFVELINLGLLEREKVRSQIREGKPNKR
jgi:hypothetical protein